MFMQSTSAVEDRTAAKLITWLPLELGGSNDIRNLWPQPDEPRPGWDEKNRLENELHAEVCAGKMPLADAQHCIAANWVQSGDTCDAG